jgi:hypothetical protein
VDAECPRRVLSCSRCSNRFGLISAMPPQTAARHSRNPMTGASGRVPPQLDQAES